MPQITLHRNHLHVLTAYLAPDNRLLDATRRTIGYYRWLAAGRIVALIHGQLYAGDVWHG